MWNVSYLRPPVGRRPRLRAAAPETTTPPTKFQIFVNGLKEMWNNLTTTAFDEGQWDPAVPPEVPFRSWTTHYADWNVPDDADYLQENDGSEALNSEQLFRQFVDGEFDGQLRFFFRVN